jgi:hypothetical protein
MQSPTPPDKDKEKTSPAPTRMAITEPNFTGTPQPISEFTGRPDFPQCARGAYVDIRGFAGVVVDIVNQSIKVRSPDGITQSFNVNRLKTLYAPPDHSEPEPMTMNAERPKPVAEPPRPTPAAPPRIYIPDPDFTAPVRLINDYAGKPDFPKCAYGKHVDILGYTGVVVEIVQGSLKIQSATGTTRSYNSEVLKKLYGKG